MTLESVYEGYKRISRKADWVDEDYYVIKENLGVMSMHQKAELNSIVVDCIPEFWLYFCGEFNGEISYLRDGVETFLTGKKGVFIPFFSIIKWKFHVTDFFWLCYQGTSDTSFSLINEPIVFDADFRYFFNEAEIIKEIASHRVQWAPIGAREETSGVAHKVKSFIDTHYRQVLNISEVAKAVGFSVDVMSRLFKKMYSVTPATYLSLLKYYQAALHITESEESLKTIAGDVGVRNYENFSKRFRGIFKTKPKNFRISDTPGDS